MSNIKTWPEEVYLQHGYEREVPDYGDCPHRDISWCDDRTDDLDVKYIRADIVEEREKRLMSVAYTAGRTDDYYKQVDLHDIQNRIDTLKQKIEEHSAIVAHFKEREEKLIVAVFEQGRMYESLSALKDEIEKYINDAYKDAGLEKLG